MMAANGQYRSWGLPPKGGPQRVLRMQWQGDGLPADGRPYLAFGNGRSYGDSCLNGEGTLVDLRGLDRFISFDEETGVLRCEAGVLLADILTHFVPKGWFLPVTPGTRYVTVGGAVANDVHGKNHHRAGSFGHHVRSLELLRSDGSRLVCSAQKNPEWLSATIGGCGLTGVILWAEIALKRVPGHAVEVESVRFSGIDEFLDLSRSSHNSHEYTVAWIDSLNPGPGGLRGVFHRGNHVAGGSRVKPPRTKPGLPFTPPVSLLPRAAVAAFNAAIYHLPRPRKRLVHHEPFFYPLDAVPNWNRLFGRNGFYQYQCVIPYEQAPVAVGELIARAAAARQGSFLSVLKVFGDHKPCGLLSFPRPGVTLALDFPNRGAPTLELLNSLDEITLAAGGAIYPAKDARMPGETFARGFPAWRQFEKYLDGGIMSDFWRRVAGSTAGSAHA